MPQVILTEGAAAGLERCRQFLDAKAPEAAKRAGQAIVRQFLLLEAAPDIGRPLTEIPELRELVIAFGDSGYVAQGNRMNAIVVDCKKYRLRSIAYRGAVHSL